MIIMKEAPQLLFAGPYTLYDRLDLIQLHSDNGKIQRGTQGVRLEYCVNYMAEQTLILMNVGEGVNCHL